MLRKVIAASTVALLVSFSFSVSPASAATKISNGVACSSVGSVKTVSGFKYRCAKNTLIKNSKLTWLSFECLDALRQFATATKAKANIKDTTAQIKKFTSDYETATAALTKITSDLDSAKKQLVELQKVMNASVILTEKQTLSVAVSKLAAAVIKLTGSKSTLSNEVRELAKIRDLLIEAPKLLNSAPAEARSNAQILCTKGI